MRDIYHLHWCCHGWWCPSIASIEVQEQQHVMETKRLQSKELPWLRMVCVLCVWICVNLERLEYDVWNGCTKTCWLLYYICSLACICHTKMLSKGCMRRWEKWEDFEPEFCSGQIWCWIRWIFSRSMDCSFSWNGRWQKIPPKWKLELLTETSHFGFQPFVFSAM